MLTTFDDGIVKVTSKWIKLHFKQIRLGCIKQAQMQRKNRLTTFLFGYMIDALPPNRNIFYGLLFVLGALITVFTGYRHLLTGLSIGLVGLLFLAYFLLFPRTLLAVDYYPYKKDNMATDPDLENSTMTYFVPYPSEQTAQAAADAIYTALKSQDDD